MSLLQALDEVLTFTSDLLPDYIFANPGRKWVKRAVKSNDATMPQGKTVGACSAERKRQLTMCMYTHTSTRQQPHRTCRACQLPHSQW